MPGKLRIILGLANHEGGYFVPGFDFKAAGLLDDRGDHYEEAVSMGPRSSSVLLEKLFEMLE